MLTPSVPYLLQAGVVLDDDDVLHVVPTVLVAAEADATLAGADDEGVRPPARSPGHVVTTRRRKVALRREQEFVMRIKP